MDTFSTSDLRRLTASQQGLCVSIFMPTHAAGRDGQQDALRLKNLLARAERGLVDQGVRSPEAKKLLDPVRDLPNQAGFWEKRSHGLAVFLTDGVFDRFRVPLELSESVIVNQRFQVKPLLPLLGGDDAFLVLALSKNRVRLLGGSQQGMREIPVEGMPADIDQALNIDTAHRASQVHSAMRGDYGKQAAVFHGQGGERDTAKDDLTQYFRMVDAALRPVLRDQKRPMFLAGVQYLLPIFREVCSYPHLATEELPGNPEHLHEQDLHARAWPLMQRHLTRSREAALEKYHHLAGTGKATDDIRQIAPAAHQGQVESLFVDRSAHQWGVFEPSTGEVTLHESPLPANDDLLDLAAVQTLLHRGDVYTVESNGLPARPIAAVFRY
jgi:hypothetical protein